MFHSSHLYHHHNYHLLSSRRILKWTSALCLIPTNSKITSRTTSSTIKNNNKDIHNDNNSNKNKKLSSSSFHPRTKFISKEKLFWYPGNQAKALKQLEKGIGQVDLVIELRDARIPFSSVNPAFETILGRRPRLIVFNKSDLANPHCKKPLIEAFQKYENQSVLFTSTHQPKAIKAILNYAKDFASSNPHIYPSLSIVLVGLPNVGKSSLTNKLRNIGMNKAKVSVVGPNAGVTTTIQTRVRIWNDPPLYLVDTPGVLCPSILNPIQSLKIALTGGTKDRLTNRESVADYLLFRINLQVSSRSLLMEKYSLDESTNDIHILLKQIAVQLNLKNKGRVYKLTRNENDLLDIARALDLFIQDFRDGHFGQVTLDDCSDVGLLNWFSNSFTGMSDLGRKKSNKVVTEEKGNGMVEDLSYLIKS